jgi:hypothetical protein
VPPPGAVGAPLGGAEWYLKAAFWPVAVRLSGHNAQECADPSSSRSLNHVYVRTF